MTLKLGLPNGLSPPRLVMNLSTHAGTSRFSMIVSDMKCNDYTFRCEVAQTKELVGALNGTR